MAIDRPCPHCNGDGKIFVASRYVDGWQDCQTCGATGRVSAKRFNLIQIGRGMREARLAMGLSLREQASRLGIEPQELARRERGEPT